MKRGLTERSLIELRRIYSNECSFKYGALSYLSKGKERDGL